MSKIKTPLLYTIIITFILHQIVVLYLDRDIINILKIANSIAVSIYIFLNLKEVKIKEYKKIYFYIWISVILLAFGGDLLYDVFYRNSNDSIKYLAYFAIDFVYLLLLISVFVVCILVIKLNWKKIDKTQTLIDFIAILVCSYFMLLGIIKAIFPGFNIAVNNIDITLVSLALASLLLLLIVIMSVKQSSGNKLKHFIVIVCTYIYLAIFDTIYTYQEKLYDFSFSRAMDFLYILPMITIALASNHFIKDENIDLKEEDEKAQSHFGITLIMLLVVIVNIVLYFLGALEEKNIVVVFGSLVVYLSLTLNYKNFKENKSLLESQIHINYELEKRVYERTRELEDKNKEFLNIINTDSLTTVGSRNYLIEILDIYKKEGKKDIIIFVIDIIHFKNINNISGHRVGDMVLKEVASRLRDIFENVFRTDSNEFAVLLSDKNLKNDLDDISERIISELTKTIYVDAHTINLNIAVGSCEYNDDIKVYEELLKNAEYASKQAKLDYKLSSNYRYYDCDMAKKTTRRSKIEALLQTIDYDNEFKLHFQPQFSIDGSRLIGMESLLRWNSPILGFVSPGEFIQIAKDSDAILKIVKWTIYKASNQIKIWNERYNTDYKIAINISPEYLENYDFLTEVKHLVNDKKIKPKWLDFEITEMTVMQVGESVLELFESLNEMGVTISIDDFGTGYSSLSYIKNFRVNKIKIAKELIDNIATDKNEYMVVNAIIMMSNGLRLETIAEGVEYKEQIEVLKEIGCEQIQGYYYGRPVPSDEFEEVYLKKIEILENFSNKVFE